MAYIPDVKDESSDFWEDPEEEESIQDFREDLEDEERIQDFKTTQDSQHQGLRTRTGYAEEPLQLRWQKAMYSS